LDVKYFKNGELDPPRIKPKENPHEEIFVKAFCQYHTFHAKPAAADANLWLARRVTEIEPSRATRIAPDAHPAVRSNPKIWLPMKDLPLGKMPSFDGRI